jgi:hypothetical protein
VADEAWTEHYYGQEPGQQPHPTCIETTSHGDIAAGKRTFVCGPDCPKPAGPDPARDARIDLYRDRERRRAARALDRYIDTQMGDTATGLLSPTDREVVAAAGERFIEQVGDYVLARLEVPNPGQSLPAHAWREYNATGNTCHYPGCGMSEDEHAASDTHHNADSVGGPGLLFGADAHGGAPDGIGSLPFEGCDWPAEQCSGHYSIRKLPECKCGFRAPELGPHPACLVHSPRPA